MKPYKFLEHTADAKFQAYGKTIEEAFSNAALAMFSIMTDTEKVEGKVEKKINVKGADLKSLLYSFLEELLFLMDSEAFILNKIKTIKIKKNKKFALSAIASGDKISDEYELHGGVKAVTYNEMEIDEEKAMVQVVVDL